MGDIDHLRSIALFSDMDDLEVGGLLAIMTPAQFISNQIIIHEDDPGEFFYVITEGEVQFLTVDLDNNEIIIDEAGVGEYFGELSLLTGEKRSVRVRSKNAVTALALQRDQFHDFLVKHPHAALDVIAVLGRRLSKTDTLVRNSTVKNVNKIIAEKQTLGQRIADGFAGVMGSWPFILVQSFILAVWVTLNIVGWREHWDPYPFILLNLALSFQAAYAAPIIMMSQNRQSDKDRLAAEIDHEVNVKAELKISMLTERLESIETSLIALREKRAP